MDENKLDYFDILEAFGEERISDRCNWLKDLMTYPFATQVLWNKLFKKQAIGNIIFNPQLRNSGDGQFLLDLLCKPLRVAFVPQPLYYYVVRDNSITHRYSIRFFAGRYSVWKCAIGIANKMYQKGNIPWMSVVYREWFIPTAFMLAVFIILQDVNNEYNKEFWEVHSVFYRLQQSPMRLPASDSPRLDLLFWQVPCVYKDSFAPAYCKATSHLLYFT